jgi:C_GCAxxG_C_C family probable redox protein
MSKQSDAAVDTFKSGFNCAQAVFGTYCEQFGVGRETAYKTAAGFGGGMRIGSVCGAVTGAFMVLGLKYGNSTAGDKGAKKKACEIMAEFTRRFEERNGSVMCRDLLGLDVNTPKGHKEAREKGLLKKTCPQMVRDAAELLEELL